MAATLQENCITGDNGQLVVQGTYWRAQTFTPTVTHTITSVKLIIYRKTSPGTVTVSIRATDVNGQPTGTDLCSGTTNGNTLPTGPPYDLREITFGVGYQLTAGIKYAIVVRVAAASVRWRFRNTSGYANGQVEQSDNSGSTWVSYSAFDCMFEEWGEVSATGGGKILLETGDGLLQEDLTGNYYILQETVGGMAYLRLIASGLTLSATIGRSRGKKKTINSALTLSATINRIRGRKRTITSALALAATIGKKVEFKKIITSALTLSATIAKKVEFHRTVDSALTLAATIIRRGVKDTLVTINSALSLSATIGRKVESHRAVASSLILSATISNAKEFHRAVASELTLSATISRARGVKKTITSALTLAATIARKVEWHRAISSNLTLAATIVTGTIAKIYKVIVTEGNVFAVKVIEGNIRSVRTVLGNVFSVKTIEGAVHTIRTAAEKLFGVTEEE